MAVDVFGVSIRFIESGIYEAVRMALKSEPQVKLQAEETTAAYQSTVGEYCDGTHIIEFQLANERINDVCTLSVRFSLCNYASIDDVFTELLRRFLSISDADVWLMTSAIHQKDHYPPGESVWLISVIQDEIRSMREYWQNLFGTRQGTVHVRDSFSFVGGKNAND